LFCWLITKINFFVKTAISKEYLVGLFVLKVFVGIVYALLFKLSAEEADSWLLFYESVKETHLLFSNPHEYFTNIFQNNYINGFEKVLDTNGSYWNDLKSNIVIKLLSVFNLLSFNNYYINLIFFNFLVFFGPIALYKLFCNYFKQSKSLIIVGCFFIPSTIFFNSGLQKDGLVFLCICLAIYYFNLLFIYLKISFKSVLLFIISILVIGLIRNFYLLAILPAMFAWFVATKFKKQSLFVFIGCYALFLLLFFNFERMFSNFNLLQKVCDRHEQFASMIWARSYITTIKLEPTFIGFAKYFPTALNLSLLRPYPSEAHNLFYFASAAELITLIFTFIIFLFFRKNASQLQKPIILFCFFFSLTAFVIIGYTVPIIGAIVRYRSIFLPIFFTPILCMIDWKKLKNIFNVK
jgi:hypothetical protein